MNSTEHLHGEMTRLPELAESIIQFNVDEELAALHQGEHGRASKTLVKQKGLRVVLISMKSGSHIERHTAPGSISVQCVKGKMEMRMDNRTLQLMRGNVLVLEPNLQHDVLALEDAAFLLTIAWPSA